MNDFLDGLFNLNSIEFDEACLCLNYSSIIVFDNKRKKNFIICQNCNKNFGLRPFILQEHENMH